MKKFKNLLYFELEVNEENFPDFSLINEILKAANPHTVISLLLYLTFPTSDLSQVQGLQINHFYNLEELAINGYKQLQKFLDDTILQSIAQSCSKLTNLKISGNNYILFLINYYYL